MDIMRGGHCWGLRMLCSLFMAEAQHLAHTRCSTIPAGSLIDHSSPSRGREMKDHEHEGKKKFTNIRIRRELGEHLGSTLKRPFLVTGVLPESLVPLVFKISN